MCQIVPNIGENESIDIKAIICYNKIYTNYCHMIGAIRVKETLEQEKELSLAIQEKLNFEELEFDPEQLKKSYTGIYNRVFKRCIDFVLALAALLVLWPFYLIISLAIVIETGFPILYRAPRGGYRGKTFKICKFRTMVKDADKIGGGTTALNDSRITKVGAILRKTKLDEITQLLNILGGTMSFVGPRPELVKYTSQYDELEKNILNVRPGITDYSSLTFINLDEIVGGENADEMYEKYVLKQKNKLRLKYVSKVSFATDVKLFVLTVLRVFKKALRVFSKKRKDDKDIVESVD